jgi:hypothetical protein
VFLRVAGNGLLLSLGWINNDEAWPVIRSAQRLNVLCETSDLGWGSNVLCLRLRVRVQSCKIC